MRKHSSRMVIFFLLTGSPALLTLPSRIRNVINIFKMQNIQTINSRFVEKW